MTTLTKTALFTFDPGSPFIPEVPPTVTCSGVPDPVYAPAVTAPVSPVGGPGWPFVASIGGGGGGGSGMQAVIIGGTVVYLPINLDGQSKTGG